MLQWPKPKDADEILDYVIDWTPRLAGDTIASSTWVVPVGITKDDDSFSESAAKIWLSGGTDGETYIFLNRITTIGGRTMDQSVKLKAKSK